MNIKDLDYRFCILLCLTFIFSKQTYNKSMDMVGEPRGLRYVIYARRSSDESQGKQVRSIGDQIKECREMARRLNLNVVRPPIEESRSARFPNRRPKFSALLRDIKTGKVDGIIAWHPDRLARNMIEAGRMIHMLDTGDMKDLRFVSHQFSNDANGKMLLGMLFVFAKHYTDDLSSKVRRGVKGNLEDGKSGGTAKKGYIREDSGLYVPDGKNFDLLRRAWDMKAAGHTDTSISEFLNKNHFQRYMKQKDIHVDSRMNPTMVARMFNDTFYYGVLNQADQTVDLRKIHLDFQPLVSEDFFYRIQNMRRQPVGRGAAKYKARFLPARRMVYCGVCGSDKYMSVAPSTGRDKRQIIYFSCKNKECKRSPKNLRAKALMNSIEIDWLEKYVTKISIEAYEQYLQEIKRMSMQDKSEIRSDVTRTQNAIKRLDKERDELMMSMAKMSNKTVIAATEEKIARIMQEIDDTQTELDRLLVPLRKVDVKPLPAQEFRERIENISIKFRKADVFQKEAIIREVFSKLVVDDKKVISVIWKEPFQTIMEITKISLGWG